MPRVASTEPAVDKRPFDVAVALGRIREAVKPFPKAALFELAEDGFSSVFQQVVACIISVRTYDEVTLVLARRLFARASAAATIASLSVEEIDALIGQSSFHEAKARQIHQIAELALQQFDGALPCDEQVLLSLPGVGHKCANLVLGIACHEPHISVDIHVHRVTNRWGYIQERTPDESLKALEAVLPRQHWIEINELLVPFGKHICTGRLPHCSTCPVLDMCRRIGVSAHA
jgi:endonuclease-3